MSEQLKNELLEKFKNTLRQGAFEAQQIHKLAKDGEFEWAGNECLDLAQRLKEIYNAFTTGEKFNDLHAGEIFK